MTDVRVYILTNKFKQGDKHDVIAWMGWRLSIGSRGFILRGLSDGEHMAFPHFTHNAVVR